MAAVDAGKVWIDTNTGTWGTIDGLVIVDLDKAAESDHDSDDDGWSLLAALETFESDSEINDFGKEYGEPLNR